MGLHYQVKPRWIFGSLKSEIGCQKILTGVWAIFYGFLLSGSEDDIYADPDVISSDIPLAVSSVIYQECLLMIFLMRMIT